MGYLKGDQKYIVNIKSLNYRTHEDLKSTYPTKTKFPQRSRSSVDISLSHSSEYQRYLPFLRSDLFYIMHRYPHPSTSITIRAALRPFLSQYLTRPSHLLSGSNLFRYRVFPSLRSIRRPLSLQSPAETM